MKVEEALKKRPNIRGIKIKVPEGHPEYEWNEGYLFSQWGYEDGKAGVWLKRDMNESRIYPVFLDKLVEILDWEVAE